MNQSSRRTFVASAVAAAGAGLRSRASAAEPPKRLPGSAMKLSLAAYSFHRLMARRGTPEEIARARMSIESFIDFCAEQRLHGTELTTYYFPAEITADYLNSLKQRTHRLGLSISGTAIGNDFCLPPGPQRDAQLEECRRWIDVAADLGAPVIRIFAGHVPPGDSEDAAVARCVDAISQVLEHAARRGVFLALENHGGVTATADGLLRLVRQVPDSPWFGVNFDSGNFRSADPYGELKKIAPYAVNAQIKVRMHPEGRSEPTDFARVIGILKDAGYRGFVVLEYEEAEDPFTAIPRYLDLLRDQIQAS